MMMEGHSDKLPLVSISCITYNHEKYIAKAIEGFLMQKTTFPFEILIHDDASTDGTASIIRKFEAEYPDIIKPIYQTANQFSQGIATIHSTYNFPRAHGKYIAMCEGDDYWTDPLKLQKQVDFLENNDDYGLVYTGYKVFVQNENRFKSSTWQKVYDGDVFQHLLYNNFVSTQTVCFRRELLTRFDYSHVAMQKFKIGDWPLWLTLSKHTKFHYIPDITSVYRVLENSAMHGSLKKEVAMIKAIDDVTCYFFRQEKDRISTFHRYKILTRKYTRPIRFFATRSLSMLRAKIVRD